MKNKIINYFESMRNLINRKTEKSLVEETAKYEKLEISYNPFSNENHEGLC